MLQRSRVNNIVVLRDDDDVLVQPHFNGIGSMVEAENCPQGVDRTTE